MRLPWSSILVLGLAALSVPVTRAEAQAAPLQGTFAYVAEGSDDVEKSIEQAIARMNFVTRPIARGRLRKTNTPYQAVTIRHTPEQVTIVTDKRAPIVTPANGTPIKWKREDGEVLDVSTEWENGTLEQTFLADDGKRVNSYTLAPDGNTLLMKVTVTSPRLPAPLTYTLRYRRQS